MILNAQFSICIYVLCYQTKNAQQEQDSKTVCCCCCESGPITAVLRLDRTGYVPGEVISCNAEINDGSGHGTASSKVKFKMVGVRGGTGLTGEVFNI